MVYTLKENKRLLLLFLIAAAILYKLKNTYDHIKETTILENQVSQVIIISATNQASLKTTNETSILIAEKLEKFLLNLAKYSKGQRINLNIITNEQEVEAMKEVINDALKYCSEITYEFKSLNKISRNFHDAISMSRNVSGFENPIQKAGDITWHIKFLYHNIFSYKKAIALDIDIAFRSHFSRLSELFREMNQQQIMGLAYSQNPEYRKALRDYRLKNPGTLIGDFPPGFPGFNCGVMLLDLQGMRESEEVNFRLTDFGFRSLHKKYNLTSKLGCNDYFTLMGAEYPHLFYRIDCSFNRLTVCTGYKHPLYYKYFKCDQDINIYHGAANAPIPTEYIDP